MLTRDKLIRALRARGKSDQLAQMAADMLEHIADRAHPDPTPAPSPDGFIITERADIGKDVKAEAARQMDAWRAKADAVYEAERQRRNPPTKKTPAKKAVKR